MKIAYVEILTWGGISLGAFHCYGTLWFGDKHIKLMKVLSRSEADALNDKDRIKFKGYKAGYESERFDSEEEIKKLAIETYKTHFPKAEVLIEGRGSCLDPQEIVDGPPEFMKSGNKLFVRSEEIGGYEGDEEEMEKISKQWMKLVKFPGKKIKRKS